MIICVFHPYTGRMYHYAMQEVKNTQDRVHAQLVADLAVHERNVLSILAASATASGSAAAGAVAQVVALLTEFTNAKGEYIMVEWRDLLPRLITT